MPVLDLTHVTVREPHGDRPLISDVSLRLDAGELVAVVGASGAGKTTLLETAAGLSAPSEGATIAGVPATIAFQAPERMFFEPTVEAEVGFALSAYPLSAVERRTRVVDALRRVGLDERYLERHPLSLSGGEQRLVALAAVIVAQPALLLLDEPTAGLDPERAASVVDVLRSLRADGTAILVATHEVETFAPHVDRVIALEAGAVVADGSPGHVFAPATVARLLRAGVPVPVEALVQAAPGSPREPGATVAQRAEVRPAGSTARRPVLPLPGVGAGMVAGLLIALAFFLPAPLAFLALVALAVPVIAHLAGAHLPRVARLLVPVAILGTLALGAHLFTTGAGTTLVEVGTLRLTSEGADAGARAWLRIVMPVLIGLSFAGARPPAVIARELRALLSALPLARRLAAGTGLAVLIVARLAPLMRSEIRRIERAQRARGGRPGARGVSRVRALLSIAVPAIVGTLLRAQRVAIALELRGWSVRNTGTGAPTLPRKAGALWVIGAFAVLTAAVILGTRLP